MTFRRPTAALRCGRAAIAALALTSWGSNGLVFVVASSSAVMLSGCATQTSAQVQSDATLVAESVNAIVVDLAAVPGTNISSARMGTIQSATANVKATAVQVAATPNTTAVASLQSAVNALIPLIQPYYATAPQVASTGEAVHDLVNLMVTEVGASAGQTPAGGAKMASSADLEADRTVLRAASVRARTVE